MSAPQADTSSRWWDDDDFQDRLCALLVNDQRMLQECASLLDEKDFKPLRGSKHGLPRQVVIDRALEHFKQFREPLGALARVDILEYAASISMGVTGIDQLKQYLDYLSKIKLSASDAISSKVVRFKAQKYKAAALQEMAELQLANQLSDEKWLEITRKAIIQSNGNGTTNFMETLDQRMLRRSQNHEYARMPLTFIDQLDDLLQGRGPVGPKQLGIVFAPAKRGKSMFLEWLSVVYALQRLNVLHITLEDPRSLVEDALDSIITHIPTQSLNKYPKTMERRFLRFRSAVGPRIHIADGTEGGATVAWIEKIINDERAQGFIPHALVIDYDDKILPSKAQRERRHEFRDIYNDLVALMSRYNLIGWTAAQTQRDTQGLRIISGDKIGEDIGKLQRVAFALSLGKGNWTDDSYYLWIAAAKFHQGNRGCQIVPNMDARTIFDREATRKAMVEAGEVQE